MPPLVPLATGIYPTPSAIRVGIHAESFTLETEVAGADNANKIYSEWITHSQKGMQDEAIRCRTDVVFRGNEENVKKQDYEHQTRRTTGDSASSLHL